MLLAGIVGAIIAAPLFDRVFKYHLALMTRICAPIVGIGWLVLIWVGE